MTDIHDASLADTDLSPVSEVGYHESNRTPSTSTVNCPGCGRPWTGPIPERASATAFCPHCDYPMFLKTRQPAIDANPEREPAKRRSPGVSGRDQLGKLPCPRCGEANLPDESGYCVRCGDPLVPPLPPPPPLPIPEPQIVYITTPYRRWRIAALVLAGALAVTVITVIAFWVT